MNDVPKTTLAAVRAWLKDGENRRANVPQRKAAKGTSVIRKWLQERREAKRKSATRSVP